MTPLPTHARVVVVGGGIAGCSTAYHLAKLGMREVVLLEQGKLTCGTTWHAAGLVGQTRATRNATAMSRYGIELYSSLEAETGLATGWKQCGSLNVAKTPERLTMMKRQMSRAKSFGIEFDFVSAAEAARIAPILRTDDLAGAVWIPGRPISPSRSRRARGCAARRSSRACASSASTARDVGSPESAGSATTSRARSRATRWSTAPDNGRANSAVSPA
jgi:glycine/D-amino acid oxidase-like deaminating enzyme